MNRFKHGLIYLWQFLTSRLLAIILMAVAATAMAIANIIPQQGRAPQADIAQWEKAFPAAAKVAKAIGFDHLYNSVWFYAIFALIIASICYCTSRRIYYEIKEHRHQRGLWPSIFFHVSFVVIFIGGLISFQTRMSGAIIVTEGETYSGSLLTINSRDFLYQHEQPYFFDPDSGISIALEDFHINRNSEGVIIDSYANVIVTEGEEIRDATIKVNKPLLLLSGETITLQNYGFAPRLSVTDNKTNTLVCDGFYKLPPPANADGTTSFRLPYTDITIKARYEPVLEKVRSKIKSKSTPAFQILVTDGYGKEHIKGLLKMGETLKGDIISITLKDMKYWVKFTVVKDQGIRIVYAGFLLAAVSITWRLLPLLFRRLKDDTA